MAPGTTAYGRVLVPTDGSDCAAAAAERAVDLARQYGATVHALYVADVRMSPVHGGMTGEEVRDLLGGDDPTDRVAERAEAAGVPVETAVRVGIPSSAIRAYADDVGADVVVLGTHGRTGLDRALLGSVAERVVRTSPVPVLVVPPPGGEGE